MLKELKTIAFATAVCLVCSFSLAFVSSWLKPEQERNKPEEGDNHGGPFENWLDNLKRERGACGIEVGRESLGLHIDSMSAVAQAVGRDRPGLAPW